MLTWTHDDARGPEAIPQAIRRAKALMWGPANDVVPFSQGDRVADVRALVLATFWTSANLSGSVEVRDASGRLQIDAGESRLPEDKDRLVAAGALLRTWQILMGPGSDAPTRGTWQSVDGLRALPIGDAAGWPAIAAVVVVAAIAAYAGYSSVQAAVDGETARHKLSLDYAQANMLRVQASVLETINAHIEKEREAGHPLPFTDAEKALIGGLLEAQKNAAAGALPPLPRSSLIDGLAQGVGQGLGTLGVAVALLVGAWALLKKE